MLKARICADKSLPGWPETDAEWATLKGLRTHDFEKFLGETKIGLQLKVTHLAYWNVCLQWSPDTKYARMGTATEKSAIALLAAAEKIIKEINDAPEMAATVVTTTDDPYAKLRALEKEIAIEKGEFTLFAIWHRLGSYLGSADIVVCAPWIDRESHEGADYISERVAKTLRIDEIGFVSGVIPLAKEDLVVRTVLGTMFVRHGWIQLFDTAVAHNYDRIRVDRALIITAGDPEVSIADRQEAKRKHFEKMRQEYERKKQQGN
jgi:hypothetical protein